MVGEFTMETEIYHEGLDLRFWGWFWPRWLMDNVLPQNEGLVPSFSIECEYFVEEGAMKIRESSRHFVYSVDLCMLHK